MTSAGALQALARMLDFLFREEKIVVRGIWFEDNFFYLMFGGSINYGKDLALAGGTL